MEGKPVARPLPLMRGFTKEFYGWCQKGELRFQRCSNCGVWRHVPREICAACGSWAWSWEKSGGRGRVFTWTIAERALHPGFKDHTPYAPVVVEMEEGPRLLSEVKDCGPPELEIGMEVEVVFDEVTAEVTLPRFRRVKG
ncbi:MAG: Zn-ribbon domain-containing OB-fold protein [Candidatus Binatia bacterium]